MSAQIFLPSMLSVNLCVTFPFAIQVFFDAAYCSQCFSVCFIREKKAPLLSEEQTVETVDEG